MVIKNKKIIFGLTALAIICCLLLAKNIKAANESLSVVNISTSDTPGYTIYWPEGKGHATIERAEENGTFVKVAETDSNYYADYGVKKSVKYSYRVSYTGNTLVGSASDILGGQPVLSAIKISAGTIGKAEASVIVTFRTDRSAKSYVLYGLSMNYDQQSKSNDNLNQSHTILIEKLKPNTTYHFNVKATDKNGENATESGDQTFTTPAAPPDYSLLQIIIQALTNAFSGFQNWLRS
jgi:hypothetical protein